MMRIVFAIDTEHDSIGTRLRSRVPAVDLCQHGFHFWIAQLVFWVPPVKRTQRFIERIVRLFCFRDKAQCKLMHEPRVRSRIPRWIDSFLAPLQHALRLSERALLFGVTRCREEKDFGLDVLRTEF